MFTIIIIIVIVYSAPPAGSPSAYITYMTHITHMTYIKQTLQTLPAGGGGRCCYQAAEGGDNHLVSAGPRRKDLSWAEKRQTIQSSLN